MPLVRKAFALNKDLPAWYKFTFAGDYFSRREWDAGRALMESIDDVDDNPHASAWHLLFLRELGLINQPTEVLTRLQSIEPQVSITALRDDWLGWNVPGETLEKFSASCRKAGASDMATVPAH